MTKVFICVPTLGTGGAEKFAVDLATQIDKTMFDVTVVITRKLMDGNFKEVLAEKGIRIADLSGDNYLQMLKKQIVFLRAEKPHVVHANIGSMLHVMLATKLLRIPVRLFTMHNQAEYTLGERKAQKKIYSLAFDFFGFTPVAICDSILQSIHNGFGVPLERIKKVHNGVDVTHFIPAQQKKTTNTIELINVGTMYSVKNQKMLISTFNCLYRKNSKLRLTILGDGALRPQLEQQVQELGLTDVVNMPGIQKNVVSYLQKANIYVSTSKSEGLPLTILEAMACGLPVIATAAGGTVDIVKTGENGIVVPIEDEAALERALEMMIDDEELCASCGKESRAIAQRWSLAACAQGYEALYREK